MIYTCKKKVFLNSIIELAFIALVVFVFAFFFACDKNNNRNNDGSARYVIRYHFEDDVYEEIYTGEYYEFFMPQTRYAYCIGWTLTENDRYFIDYEFLSNRKEKSDLDLFVHWKTKDDYAKITYVGNGAEESFDDEYYAVGSMIAELPSPTRDGYKFCGWYLDPDYLLNHFYASYSLIEDSIMLYAKWAKIDAELKYFISFNTLGGSLIDDQEVASGSMLVTIPVSYREGYKIEGWYIDKDFSIAFPLDTLVTASYNLYAKWEQSDEQIKVVYTNTIDDISVTEYYNYGKKLEKTDFAKVQRDGYEIIDWCVDEELVIIANDYYYLTEDIQFYALWQINIPEGFFPVSFWINNGDENLVVKYIEEGSVNYGFEPETIDGFVFDGWYVDSDYSAPYDFSIPLDSAKAIYAKWLDLADVYPEETDGVFVYQYQKGAGYLVLKYIGSGKAVLPEVFNNKLVVSYAQDMFSDSAVTEVEFNDVVVRIFAGMFKGSSLKSLIIPSYIRDIGNGAFEDCKELESVVIEAAVDIPEGAFRGCTSLKTVELRSSVSIGKECFYGCSELVSIEGKVTRVSEKAFYGCEKLDVVDFLSEDAFVEKNAFENCGISKVIVSQQQFLYPSFNNCNELKTIEFDAECNNYQSGWFENCENVQEFIVDVENSTFKSVDGCLYVYYQDSYALLAYPCNKAGDSFQAPNICEYFIGRAFANVKELNTLTIGTNIKGSYGNFLYESNINEIVILPGNEYLIMEKGAVYNGDKTEMIAYLPTDEDVFVMPDTVVTLDSYVFYRANNLRKIVMSANLASIEAYAISEMSNLTELEFGSSVVLRAYSIDNCPKLTTVNFDKVTDVYEAGFGNAAFEEIEMVNVAGISERAFYGLKELRKVTIGNELRTLGAEAFVNCEKLTEVTIGTYLKSISSGAFNGTGIKKLTLLSTENVCEIGTGDYSQVDLFVPESVLEQYRAAYSDRFKSISAISD